VTVCQLYKDGFGGETDCAGKGYNYAGDDIRSGGSTWGCRVFHGYEGRAYGAGATALPGNALPRYIMGYGLQSFGSVNFFTHERSGCV